jgi:hypothetical protein
MSYPAAGNRSGVQPVNDIIELALASLEQELGHDVPPRPVAVIRNSSASLRTSPKVILAGPWIGELGVSLIRWIPYLRYLKSQQDDVYFIAGGYRAFACLYRDFCDEYWILPDSYQKAFQDKETSFNYGVFHEVAGHRDYREHALRKGFPATDRLHKMIALQWFRQVVRRRLSVYSLVTRLGDERLFLPLSASRFYQSRMLSLLERKSIVQGRDPIIMFLPRCRKLQSEQRSWNPDFYKEVATRLVRDLGVAVVLLGSVLHEAPLVNFARESPKMVNLLEQGLEQQIAFWEVADLGLGPPSGGLVPGYLTGTPLLFWYKPDRFPRRHGRRWDEVAEADYSVFGIKAQWVEVSEDPLEIQNVVDGVAHILSEKTTHS